MVEFTSTIRNWGTKQCDNLVRPKLTNAMWGAGLSFHVRTHKLKNTSRFGGLLYDTLSILDSL